MLSKAFATGVLIRMHHVYRIQNTRLPIRFHVGFTGDLKARPSHHDCGCGDYIRPFAPWTVVWYSAFKMKEKARLLERYLKSRPGIAFARKRLW